jgi:signal transduction histidine kinase
MPGIDGLAVAQLVHDHDPSAAIVMMTAYASYDHLLQAMQYGISDFVPKPFDLTQLLLAVTQALHRRDVIRDNVRLRALEALRRDSEVLTTTLEYRTLVPTILGLAVRWSGWPVAALLVGNTKTPLTAVTMSDQQWTVTVAGVDFAHRVLHERTLQTGAFVAFAYEHQKTTLTIGIPLIANDIQAVLLIGTDDPFPNLPSVNELLTLLAKQSITALQNADVYGHMAGLYRKQRQIEAMKDEFVALASHELRTPLTMVIAYTDVLARSLTGTELHQIDEIRANATRMKQIVDTLSELQTSGTTEALIPQEFDVVAIIRQVIEQVNERYPRVRIQLQTQQPILSVTADDRWVRVLVSQLLMNAAEHARGERVDVIVQDTVRRDMPEPVSHDRRRWLTVTVIDHGIGIADIDQLHLFAPFVQLDDSLTRTSTGAGLGLALVYDIVQRMEGYVWVSSNVGEGSVFAVMLPVS